MYKPLLVALLFFAVCCKEKPRSLEEIKNDFGQFQNQTIKLLPIDYTQYPINNAIAHHPENYEYLEGVNLFSVGHISDGLFITGLMVAPKKEGKYPVIVISRGGNRDLGLLSLPVAINQMAPFAAEGYVVIGTNYRGNSRGEGNEEFGGADVNDIKNLISSLAELDMADTSRIGLFGISRGGMMNYLTIKDHSTSIQTVVNIGGITDLEVTTKYHPEIDAVMKDLIPNYQLNKKPEIKKRSAIHWTDRLPKTTPILILHGTQDQHVNYAQIPPFVDSLKRNNIPFKHVAFENDNHGINNHRKEVMQITMEWFDTYLKQGQSFDFENQVETIP